MSCHTRACPSLSQEPHNIPCHSCNLMSQIPTPKRPLLCPHSHSWNLVPPLPPSPYPEPHVPTEASTVPLPWPLAPLKLYVLSPTALTCSPASEVLNQNHPSTGGCDESDLQTSFASSPSLECSDFFPTLILGGPVRMRILMPKHVDCSQPQHQSLAFTTATSCPTPLPSPPD